MHEHRRTHTGKQSTLPLLLVALFFKYIFAAVEYQEVSKITYSCKRSLMSTNPAKAKTDAN